MSKVYRAALAAVLVAAATPAFAQRYAPRYYAPPPSNAARLELGIAGLYSGSYCDRFGCSGSTSWSALTVGGDIDVGFSRLAALTVGLHDSIALGREYNPNVLEPTIGVTFRFPVAGVVQPRLGVGLGILIGSDNVGNGAAFRLDGGLSLFPRNPVGLALDLAVDVGSFADSTFTKVQFAFGPEIHF